MYESTQSSKRYKHLQEITTKKSASIVDKRQLVNGTRQPVKIKRQTSDTIAPFDTIANQSPLSAFFFFYTIAGQRGESGERERRWWRNGSLFRN